MISIKSSETWVFWPTRICAAFFDMPGNRLISGDKDFELELEFKITRVDGERGTVLSINPDFFVLHYYSEDASAIHMATNSSTTHNIHQDIKNLVKLNTKHKLSIINKYNSNFISYIDDIKVIDTPNFNNTNDPQILIGSEILESKEPNLNSCDMELYSFKLYNSGKLVANHNFEEFIHNKSVDITGNCNFIHKI